MFAQRGGGGGNKVVDFLLAKYLNLIWSRAASGSLYKLMPAATTPNPPTLCCHGNLAESLDEHLLPTIMTTHTHMELFSITEMQIQENRAGMGKFSSNTFNFGVRLSAADAAVEADVAQKASWVWLCGVQAHADQPKLHQPTSWYFYMTTPPVIAQLILLSLSK